MRLIDADALREKAEWNDEATICSVGLREIDFAPTVDAIVLSCKVGDTVWYIRGGYYMKNKECMKPVPIVVTEISQKMVRGKLQTAFIANGSRYTAESVGKTVFLSCEDAEAAIAKRR